MPTPGCPFARAERNIYHPASNVNPLKMFDYRANGTPISKSSVHMSVNAARRSACATLISIFYQASQKLSGIAQECVRHNCYCVELWATCGGRLKGISM